MSRSAGTGSPVWFHCHEARRKGVFTGHVVNLTGRERPYHPKRGSAAGRRSSEVSREYVCSCGHTGWSNHVSLERLAARDE